MATEIERKFLVQAEAWQQFKHQASDLQGTPYRQGYIASYPERTVRVRIAGDQAFLTIKGPTVGCSRSEYEYPIPVKDAAEMLDHLCPPPWIEKTRYKVEEHGLLWEVDEFAGDNAGLILAEVELTAEDQAIALPNWVGEEVSQDSRYFNAALAQNPFTQWPK